MKVIHSEILLGSCPMTSEQPCRQHMSIYLCLPGQQSYLSDFCITSAQQYLASRLGMQKCLPKDEKEVNLNEWCVNSSDKFFFVR